MIIFVILVVLVAERYANRSDTKAVIDKGLGSSKESQSYFSQEEMGF